VPGASTALHDTLIPAPIDPTPGLGKVPECLIYELVMAVSGWLLCTVYGTVTNGAPFISCMNGSSADRSSMW
jgi:hypothetical protein